MMKARYAFIKNLRYLCLVGVMALGLMTIVGSNGGGGGGSGSDGSNGGGESQSIVVPRGYITIDGYTGDWSGINPVIEDVGGDTTCGAGTDIKSVYLANDNDYLYWRMDTWSGTYALENDQAPTLIFYQYSGQHNVIYAVSAQADSITTNENGQWNSVALGQEYGIAGHVYEGKIPLYLIEGHDFNTLLSHYYSGTPNVLCDEIQLDNIALIIDAHGNNRPTATITSPSDGSTYAEGDTITFTGTGEDTEDGILTGSSLVWTSSIDDEIGTGESFTKNDLSAGTHTITFTATDSEGVTGSDSVSVTVESESSSSQGWTMLDLPDTGQTQSYTDTFGEDSDYTINPPSYTDNGDGTVMDNVTSLMWQQEADDTQRTWAEACTYCDDLSLGGFNDWRLPSKKELLSIVDCGSDNPSIDTTYFSGTNSSYYWSSTTDADDTSDACFVNFSAGSVNSYLKSDSNYVRCVRGGQ